MRREQQVTNMPRLRLQVTPQAERIVRSGHPWLFSESITKQNREGVMGELPIIYDRNNEFLALGLFDPTSSIRVRLLHTGRPQRIDRNWWERRLNSPLELRANMFDAQTTAYRVIHGESDGWPGLVLDRYENTFVLKLYTAAWLPRLTELLLLFNQQLRPDILVLRLSRNIQQLAQDQFGALDGQILSGSRLTGPVHFLENGLHFEADVCRGQKTGFFLDQRENRRRVEALAAGKHVLNLFSFTGAFSVYAGRGGALSSTDLDISPYALKSASRNFLLNQTNHAVASCQHELIQADSFEWLQDNRRKKFDLIILDPPSLARAEPQRAGALHAYESLAYSALLHLRPGGILVACSCSAHVTAVEFFTAVRAAGTRAGTTFAQSQTRGHPPDHPARFKESEYLKAIYLISSRPNKR